MDGCMYRMGIKALVDGARPPVSDCSGPMCLNVGPRPLLRNFKRSLVDPDTPQGAYWRRSHEGKRMKLVVRKKISGDWEGRG